MEVLRVAHPKTPHKIVVVAVVAVVAAAAGVVVVVVVVVNKSGYHGKEKKIQLSSARRKPQTCTDCAQVTRTSIFALPRLEPLGSAKAFIGGYSVAAK